MSAPASERNRFNGRFYPLDNFDRHLCLKPPFGLLLCMMFLCRDLLFALISTLSSMKGPGMDMSSLLSHEHRLVLAAGMLPALPVFIAYLNRVPDSSAFVRWIWKHGAKLLAAAAIIQSIPSILALAEGHSFGGEFFEGPWILLLTATMLVYLFGSKRIQDTFSDFPEK